jgi:hypothetical protein
VWSEKGGGSDKVREKEREMRAKARAEQTLLDAQVALLDLCQAAVIRKSN